jgi:fermentation-respiration switch protein FrsA (DUF1100 family)
MLIQVLLIASVAWLALAFVLQRQVLFPRHLVNQLPAAPRPADAEQWWLDTDAGPVEAWLLSGRGVGSQSPGPAVMFAHGNGERIDLWPAPMHWYRDLGVSVLLVEYRGYGGSAGRPSAAAILDDLARFHERLAARADVDADRIVFHGRSLGGAALGTLAVRQSPAALILESTFTSTADIARRYLIPPMLVRDRFDALAGVQSYAGPVLLLHGRRDTIIPPYHAERLHAAARAATLVWFETDHNDPMPRGQYHAAIEDFLREHGVLTATR